MFVSFSIITGMHTNTSSCPDGQGRACQSPSTTSVPIGDDQHSGSRSREVEEEICILDPGSPHRRQGSREGSLGRTDGGQSPRRMGEHADTPGGQHEGQLTSQRLDAGSSYFFVDTEAMFGEIPLYYCEYERHSDAVLGDVRSPDDQEFDKRSRCFNCGSPEHTLPSCPEPRNRELIALSRQLFEFHKDENALVYRRYHEVENWKRQRIQWLEHFEPGQVRGELLREALGIEERDQGGYVEWLRNISEWGYPKGWVGQVDPRLEVWKVISGITSDDSDVEEDDLIVFGEEERLIEQDLLSPSDDGHEASEPEPESTPTPEESTIRRWATYPDTYFSSELLPVYNGSRLPPLGSDIPAPVAVSSTFTSDRQDLWNKVLSQAAALSRKGPPAPAPPTSTPPPLPPPSTPPPLPPTEPPSSNFPNSLLPTSVHADCDGSEVESDMDLSD